MIYVCVCVWCVRALCLCVDACVWGGGGGCVHVCFIRPYVPLCVCVWGGGCYARAHPICSDSRYCFCNAARILGFRCRCVGGSSEFEVDMSYVQSPSSSRTPPLPTAPSILLSFRMVDSVFIWSKSSHVEILYSPLQGQFNLTIKGSIFF